jgi:histone H3/H4
MLRSFQTNETMDANVFTIHNKSITVPLKDIRTCGRVSRGNRF